MPRGLVLILPCTRGLAQIEDCLAPYWLVHKIRRIDNSIDLQVNEDDVKSNELLYFTIGEPDSSNEVREHYASNELIDPNFRSGLTIEHRFFSVTYNNVIFCNRVLTKILESLGASLKSSWIDTDYGNVIPAERALKRIHSDLHATWDSM